MTNIDKFRHLSDIEWLDVLIKSTQSSTVNGLHLPKFPPESVQAQFVGSSNENALREGFRFYEFFKTEAAKAGTPLHTGSNILDFGTGWGRYLRFFWKDVSECRLHGVDTDPEIIDLCRSLNIPGQLARIEPLGCLPYEDASMDVILAYSVFTHLPENVHLHWMNEFKRVTRRGGIVAMTIEPRRFLEFVIALKGRPPESGWHAGLQRFSDYASAMLPAYDSGQLVYLPTGGGNYRDAIVYGDAVCPISFFETNWMPEFALRAHVDDPQRFWQAAVVLQRM
ncbi:MAG: class I SAM-dependent methyltransferase [Rhizobium sp.]|nr:class I SAM-dependent methyltransferase [Rhizobium sp.]